MSPINSNISFVIPAFNCSETIKESVESIIDGNFSDGDEIIIINDASTDETGKVLAELKLRHPFLTILKNQQNKGCPATRNIGIKEASRALIFNLDSDNILAPGSIEKLKNYFKDKKADIAAFCEYHYFQKDILKVSHKWICKPGILTLADFLSGPINPGPGGNFLYTKAVWEMVGGYWEYGKGLHEAWGFSLKLLANGAKFVVMPDSHYYHRYGHESLFIRESKAKYESSLMATKMLMNYINLIDDEDAAYIRSEEGSKRWFNEFSNHPIRLKSGEKGINGRQLKAASNKNLISRLKSIVKPNK